MGAAMGAAVGWGAEAEPWVERAAGRAGRAAEGEGGSALGTMAVVEAVRVATVVPGSTEAGATGGVEAAAAGLDTRLEGRRTGPVEAAGYGARAAAAGMAGARAEGSRCQNITRRSQADRRHSGRFGPCGLTTRSSKRRWTRGGSSRRQRRAGSVCRCIRSHRRSGSGRRRSRRRW